MIFQLLALFRSRRALASLDARLLSDIGLTAEAAAHEAARPFWDVPPHWVLEKSGTNSDMAKRLGWQDHPLT